MPTVSANKFNIFVQNVGRGVHNLNSNALKLALTNTSPNAADTVFDTTTSPPQLSSTSNAPELTTTGGYTAGGAAVSSNTYSQTSGTATLAGTPASPTWTGSGGGFGPFRYVFLYDSTAGSTSTRPPILWWDYGSSISPAVGETFTVTFPSNILTIA